MTLSTLLVLAAPWMHLLKARLTLLVPVDAIALLMMTQRYVVLLTENVTAIFEYSGPVEWSRAAAADGEHGRRADE